MSHNSYGIVIEGSFDEAVYPVFVRKIANNDVTIYTRPCGGVSKLMEKFAALLQELQHVQQGTAVEKALVIRDSNGKSLSDLHNTFQEKIANREFSFPHGVHFCITRREMETWLLADEQAIHDVVFRRSGRDISGVVNGALEDIVDPKDRLIRMLSGAKVPYDPAVCRELAQETRLEQLRYRCPSFRSFEDKVSNC